VVAVGITHLRSDQWDPVEHMSYVACMDREMALAVGGGACTGEGEEEMEFREA